MAHHHTYYIVLGVEQDKIRIYFFRNMRFVPILIYDSTNLIVLGVRIIYIRKPASTLYNHV